MKRNTYMNFWQLFVVGMIFICMQCGAVGVHFLFFSEMDINLYSKLSYIPMFTLILVFIAMFGRGMIRREEPVPTVAPAKERKRPYLDPRYVLMGILYLFMISIVIEPLETLIGADDEAYLKMWSEGPVALNLIMVALAAPIMEEWFFRGMVLKGLQRRYGAMWAILISSLFFSLAHGSLVQLIPAFVIGVLLGYVYVCTNGSLATVMCIHAINNLFSYSFILLKQPDFLFRDLFASKWLYYGVYAVCAAFVLLLLVNVLRKKRMLRPTKAGAYQEFFAPPTD